MMKKLFTCLSYLSFFVILLILGCGGGASDTRSTSTDTGGAEEAPPADSTAGVTPSGSAAISGKITYEGEVPSFRPIDMGAEPSCSAKHPGETYPQLLVLGEGQTIANILVRVTEGLPSRNWAVPSEPVTLDQVGCRYTPHVLGIRVGQPLKILNSDGILHNVHALPDVNQEFNMAMPASRTEAEKVFNQAEDPFRIKCDVHPWMGAWVTVLEHPFFSVTDEDGQYTINSLSAGTYTIEAWHERLGTQTAEVTLAEGETKTSDFVFSR